MAEEKANVAGPEAQVTPPGEGLAPAPKAEPEKTVPWEQYQTLQRKHDKALKRSKELAAAQAERSVSGVGHIEEKLDGLIEALGNAETIDRPTLDQIKQRGAARKTEDARVAQNMGRMAELLEDYEGNWNQDEQFGEAREAWEAGRLEEAVQLTRAALRGSTTNPQEMKSQVAAEVQKIAKEKGWVDTGGSTGGGRKLSRREDWDNIVPGSAEEDEALAATLAAIKAQRR